MIKYHPSKQLMQKHILGELPAGLSVAISAHIELCDQCGKEFDMLEAKQASSVFSESVENDNQCEFEAMMESITEMSMFDDLVPQSPEFFEYQDKQVQLPRAIAALKLGSFINAGKVSRARFELEEGPLRSSLLHIKPGGEIPEHTHTGFELTLLLDGTFEDESGEYVPGDFIMLDGRHNHTPKTKDGCLCFTLVDNALHFNKGLSKLLNPIGKLIY
ncbi:ChrR family anti-sigma-E factor [Pseudoalteromonas luteoviolacea]|uniref:ChrR family anti-sigma-E factor n=1 Tax=Pseudoalteromonas luteoviolacea TaxID=43657 RepID=UPI00114F3DC4|nr:ChrR family anti-sigma-E factor [Pseudoalteromonas luteoviolacea]TQF67421.1 transcriptional regulator [Pseudoalteromonas luteoviolacea]